MGVIKRIFSLIFFYQYNDKDCHGLFTRPTGLLPSSAIFLLILFYIHLDFKLSLSFTPYNKEYPLNIAMERSNLNEMIMSIRLRRFLESLVREGELQNVILSFELISIGGVSSLKISVVDNNNLENAHLLQKISWKISAELGISMAKGVPQTLRDIKPIILTTKQINQLCINHNLPYQAPDLFEELLTNANKCDVDFKENLPSLTFLKFQSTYKGKCEKDWTANIFSDTYKLMYKEEITDAESKEFMNTLEQSVKKNPESRTAEIVQEHKYGIKLSK